MRDDGLQLANLGRGFPGFQLGPLSLSLHPGQVYGLLGLNGAGKTTFLDLLTLQLKATTGTLSFGGRQIRWGDSGWKARFSYIREIPSFYAELTVGQILELAGQLYPRWDPVLADSLVGTFSLRPHQRVGHLSREYSQEACRDGETRIKIGGGGGSPKGDRRRRRARPWGTVVSPAQARDVLRLLRGEDLESVSRELGITAARAAQWRDQFLAAGHPTARADLQNTIRNLIREHQSLCVVLSSHIFEDIEEAATEILILRRGRLAFRASIDTLHDSRLYRTMAPGTLAALPDLVLHWRRRDTEWLLVRRGSPLDAALGLRPDHDEEQPTSVIAAVYHGTEHTDVD